MFRRFVLFVFLVGLSIEPVLSKVLTQCTINPQLVPTSAVVIDNYGLGTKTALEACPAPGQPVNILRHVHSIHFQQTDPEGNVVFRKEAVVEREDRSADNCIRKQLLNSFRLDQNAHSVMELKSYSGATLYSFCSQ
jgi:hypothetical protein